MNESEVKILLIILAAGQLAIAVLNLFLDRLLHWQRELKGIPLLLREVFHVHKYFITITLILFGVLTLRFAEELAGGSNELGAWLAAGIGLFWAVRSVMQWTYYSWSHWRGRPGRTVAHWTLTLCYTACAVVYLYVGLAR